MGRVYYKESVQLSARKFWRFIPVFMGLIITAEIVLNKSVRLNFTVITSVLALVSVALLLSYLINKVRLKLKITSKGIQYKMVPFLRRKRMLKWKDIAACSVIQSPTYNTADRRLITNIIERKITLTGNNGISVLTKSGERYLIGSKNPEKLKKVLVFALRSQKNP